MNTVCILKKGALEFSTIENIDKGFLQGARIWIDISQATHHELEKLRDIFHLHPLTIEDMSKNWTRPKIEPFKNYDFIVLYSLYREDKIKFVEMDFLVGRNFVISNHWRKIPSFEHLQNDTLRLETLMGKGMDFLLHHLIDVEVDNYTTIISSYDNEIEQIESRTMYRPSPYSLKRLFQIKRQLLRVKKVAGPEREILSQLTKGSYDYISDDSIAYFRDIYDHVVRVYDQIDNYREVISSILEVHLSVTSNKLNETMKVLTVIATIMMPITAIGAIYGMNFRNMPELEWKYGYFLILAVMLAVTVAMIWYMKKKGWY